MSGADGFESAVRPLPRFVTERLELRMGGEGDIPGIVEYLRRNQEHFAPYEPLKPEGYYTEAFWRDQLRRSLQEFYADQSVRLFIFRSGGGVIGSVNCTQFVRGPKQSCSLGYGIGRDEQGKGYLNEALRALIPYLFEELDFHRIEASYMPRNERSARVLARLGFGVEGTARGYVRIAGRWEDHVLTGLVNPGAGEAG